MASIPADVQKFIEQCVVLTGFCEFDLHATGMGQTYLEIARDQVGSARFEEFLKTLAQREGTLVKPKDLDSTDREIARAVVYLWYTGAWPRLAETAHTELRPNETNTEFVVSAGSYVEGLVWHTFNGHPVGARPPGFGTWSVRPAEPPSIGQITKECGLSQKHEEGHSDGVEAAVLARLRHPGPLTARHVPPSVVPAARAPRQEGDPR